MTPDCCEEYDKGSSCRTRDERNRIKGLAEGERMKASNWRGLGVFYEGQGNHELAKSYYRIADFDLTRSQRLLESAEQVVKDHCPTLQRKTP